MKRAFTMLELVFVIVIAGILAAVIIPETRTNPAAEAAINLQSKIRYTQHLAIIDDKYDSNTTSTWYKDRWQIVFDDDKYSIMSNNNATFAKDTTDSNKEIKDIDLNEQGVSLTFAGGCAEINNIMYLSFDSMGRPLLGDLNNYTLPYMSTANEKILQADCNITISAGSENIVITIEPVTGNIRGI